MARNLTFFWRYFALSALVAFAATFDVASVKRVGSTRLAAGEVPPRVRSCSYTGTRVSCVESLHSLIQETWGVTDMEISGGPDWIPYDLFEVVATMPPATPKAEAREMMKVLLADRFGLKVHRESREQTVHALVPDKRGAKLQLAKKENPDAEAVQTASGSVTTRTYFGDGRFFAVSMSMDNLAQNLGNRTGLRVVDMTGLAGQYRIDVRWAPDESAESRTTGHDLGVVSAIQEQLGLRLEKRRMAVNMIVIDHVERVPSEN